MSHQISLDKAIELTTRYRSAKDNLLKSEHAGKNILSISQTFDRSAFEELLKVPGCTHVRAYFGMDADGSINLIFVAVNANNEDILPGETGGVIEDVGTKCPPHCAAAGPLNT